MISGSLIHEILVKYWGYSNFRPLQEEIIHSVLSGFDTLALLPTGGGKSLCFQVPGIVKGGTTLVITPLIALMKDQVENLKKRGIQAEAIYSGMSPREIELVMNHAVHGALQFLYVSPERLQSEYFSSAIGHMNVKLLAIDEAHCISQWGYDFRPPYLQIADIRPILPGVPVLALTATATPEVVEDIQLKLGFSKKKVFEKSFERRNLAYVVFNDEDKHSRMLRIFKNVPGSGIVYVRNRRKTREVSDFLNKNGISADFYHAGLPGKERENKQDDWKGGRKRIMVSTNAFGMGIDKPDVRAVVHIDLPESIEAYFQEAGRAGRDEKKAYAVLLYEKSDILDAQHNIEVAYPAPDIIRAVYLSLGNYAQLPVGSGRDYSIDFEISEFCSRYNFKSVTVYNALKFIEREGYISLNDAIDAPSRLIIEAKKEDLYRFQVENAKFDPLIKTILRSYGGIFTEPAIISESELARRMGLSEQDLIKSIVYLQQAGIVTYFPRKSKPQLTFVSELIKASDLKVSPQNYLLRKQDAIKRLNAIIEYATNNNHCRSISLVAYFGQHNSNRCGICDVCINRNKAELSEFDFDAIVTFIKPQLKSKEMSIHQLVEVCRGMSEEKVLKAVAWLVDNGKITESQSGLYTWNDHD